MLTSLRATQVDMVLMHLQQYCTITQGDAEKYGIHCLSDRVLALRKKGHRIQTVAANPTYYRLATEEPLLTKNQFDEVMRLYGKKTGGDYLPFALRELYSDYCNSAIPWPEVVKNAIGLNPQLVARFVAFNYFQAEKGERV